MAIKRRTVAVAIALSLLHVVVVAAAVLHLRGRSERKEADLLERAGDRFAAGLIGVTVADVADVADAVQKELRLTDRQRQHLLDGARDQIESLPRPLTPEGEEKLEALIRGAYADGKFSGDEMSAFERFIAVERLVLREAGAFKHELEGRLRAAQHHVSRGQALVQQERIDGARQEFLAATEVDPRNAVAWANLGAANMLLRGVGDALNCYERALELDPESWLANYNLGLLAAREGDQDGALEHFGLALMSLGPEASPERQAVIRNLRQDPALEALRQDSRFAALLDVEER